MGLTLSPTTVKPLASLTASGSGTRRRPTRIRVAANDPVSPNLTLVSFTMGWGGTFRRTIRAPGGKDRKITLVLQQRRSDGVWAQIASAELRLLLIGGGGGGGGGDLPLPDTRAPIISAVAATGIGPTGVTVGWSLDEAGTGQVEYGTTTAYGSLSALDSTLTLTKSRTLSGLTASTTYHYRVLSKDAANNLATSADQGFTTAATPPPPPSGPIVTVDQGTIVGTAELRLAAFGVNRYMRGGSITTAEKAAANALMAEACDLIIYHWSGGYNNANPSFQLWSARDFAPTSMGTARTWATSGNRHGLDFVFANVDALEALRPGVQAALVMYDFPEAILGGRTRASASVFSPWLASSQWGGSLAGQLCTEILARYPGKIKAFVFGQELKGMNTAITANLDDYAAGFTAWATYMRANHPTIELWYPYYNFWARNSSIAARNAAMDACLAGGGLEAADETVMNRLIDQVDPDLVDRFTIDCSIIDNSTSDPRRPPPLGSGTYAEVASRIAMEGRVTELMRAKMLSRWGVEKSVVAIESYFDVNQGVADWATQAQQAALSTGIALESMKKGLTYHARWDPQGGTPGAEAPDGNLASWFNQDGVAFPAWPQIRDLRNAIPPGTDLFDVASNNANIRAAAGGTNVYLLNTSASPIDVTVVATGGTLAAATVPAYGHLVRTLP